MALNPLVGWTAASLLPGVDVSRIARMAPAFSNPRYALMRQVLGNKTPSTNAPPPVVGSQTAPVGPSAAPGIAQSVGQKNTSAQWNPFSMSGWVSPNQSAVGSYNSGSRAAQVNNIMALGV